MKIRKVKTTLKHDRKGAGVLVVILVCFVVVSTILLSMIKNSLQFRRNLKRETQSEQAYWLLDAVSKKAILDSQTKSGVQKESVAFVLGESNVTYEVNLPETDKSVVEVAVEIGDDLPLVSRMSRTITLD